MKLLEILKGRSSRFKCQVLGFCGSRVQKAPSKGLGFLSVLTFPFKTRPTFEKSNRREVQQRRAPSIAGKGEGGEVLFERSELR